MGTRLHTITLTAFKGGVGRTTSAAALAYGLAKLGYNVALIDAGYAVPLQEKVLSKDRGRGSPPEESTLYRWAKRLSCDCKFSSRVQYIRAFSTAYLEAVLDQLWAEPWNFAVIDTPAHPTASVFEATGQSSLLLVPAREAADARVIRERMPEEFLDGYHSLRCLVAGSNKPRSVREAFSPLPVLNSEVPCQSELCDVMVSPGAAETVLTSVDNWHEGCLSLASEIAVLVEKADEWPTHHGLGLIAK